MIDVLEAPRKENQRTWFYRIRPSVQHEPFEQVSNGRLSHDWEEQRPNPNLMRWRPFDLPPKGEKVDFIAGLSTLAGAGDAKMKQGMAMHFYSCNVSMENKSFCDNDGDLIIIPQQGKLRITTEMGKIDLIPNEICVIQRGLRFAVGVEGPSRGYIGEIFEGHLTLPDRGPIGSNGLAHSRDFLTPVAAFEDRECDFRVIVKFHGELFESKQNHSPFNVVAWHGNYAPYKYDLMKFCPVNSVLYDHMDPSIYTVLTCSVCDFIFFRAHWWVSENTFRMPWFHRNCVTEFIGVIGEADFEWNGVAPGGIMVHPHMAPHGQDAITYEQGLNWKSKPMRVPDELPGYFMFESKYSLTMTKFAAETSRKMEKGFYDDYRGLKKHFESKL